MRAAHWIGSLGLAAAASLAPRQYPYGADGSTDCTDASFLHPTWYLFDPVYTVVEGGTAGDVEFTAINLSANITAACHARSVQLYPDLSRPGGSVGDWHPCNGTPGMSFQVDLAAQELSLRQTWACDRTPNIQFTANATIDLPIILACYDDHDARGATETCLLGDESVHASLSAPVAVDPQPPDYPYTPEDDYRPLTCVGRSDDPQWTVGDLVFGHAAAESGDAFGELTFRLTNLQNGLAVSCTTQIDPRGGLDVTLTEKWADCTTPTGAAPPPDGILATRIMFDAQYRLLGVNQTWTCPDSRPNYDPSTFSGIAYLSAALQCTTPSHPGEDSDLPAKCTLPTTNVTGFSSTYVPSIPHTAYARSCTLFSLNATRLVLEGYAVRSGTCGGTTSGGTAATTADFTIANPGPGDAYRLSDVPLRDDGAWHACGGAGSRPLPWQLVSCLYMVDAKSGAVGFRVQWYCDDLDADHAILFNATAVGQLLAGAACGLSSNATGVELGIEALSWVSTRAPMDRGPPLLWV